MNVTLPWMKAHRKAKPSRMFRTDRRDLAIGAAAFVTADDAQHFAFRVFRDAQQCCAPRAAVECLSN
jgi:hypothetical protein